MKRLLLAILVMATTSCALVHFLPRYAHASEVVAAADAGASSGIGTSPSEPAKAAPPDDPWVAFGAGHYAMGIVLLLITALSLLKKAVPKLFSSDLAGAATAFLSSFLGALATNGTAVFSWGGVKAAFVVAVLAMGGYSVLWRKLLKPGLKWIADKAGWTRISGVLS